MTPKPVTAIPPKHPQRLTNNSNRSWYFGMVIACLLTFGAIVIGDYFVQRKVAHDALALAISSQAKAASPSPTPTATSTPTPKPTPTEKPTPDEYDDLLDGLVAEENAKKRPTPIPNEIETYLDPKPVPPLPTATSIPRPVPRATPRIERVVSARDVLSIGFRKREDSRRYRFQLESIARIKGSFSSSRGGVTVRILSGLNTLYVSGFNVSGDSIDVALYPGVYELQVTLVGSDTEFVSFNVNASAYYNPE